MNNPVKVGDEFAVDMAGRFSSFSCWQFRKVAKVTPSGKFRLRDQPDALWSLSVDGAAAYSAAGDRWAGRQSIYRVTDENRAHFEGENEIYKLRSRYSAARHKLYNHSVFNADLMTEERVAMLEQFLEETKV